MGILGIIFAAIVILLVLLGTKIASRISGTILNLSISLCLLCLSVGGLITFPMESHSLIILMLGLISNIATLLLIGVCVYLAIKLLRK